MKKNNINFGLITLISILAIFGFKANCQHNAHSTTHSNGVTIDLKKVLKDFDVKKAEALMDSLNIPVSERTGYLKTLKARYIKQAYPDFTFLNEQQSRFVDYKPKNRDVMKGMYCSNAGFEFLDFSNWIGYYGFYGTAGATAGFVSSTPNASVFDPLARHTIMTTPPLNNDPGMGAIVGYDPIAISATSGLAEIPFLPIASSGVTCRLGNAETGAEAEKLIFPISVTPSNTSFFYQFAIVIQDPGHDVFDQPYFQIAVKDSLGNPVGGVCGIYNINSTLAATDPSFIQITYASEPLYYRKWELVGVDLSALIGQDITIEFETADCNLGGHFGYAYIDADCGLLNVSASFCDGENEAILAAPGGFDSYQWSGPNSSTPIPGATNDTLIVFAPTLGDTFNVTMVSASGCITNLSTTIDTTQISIYSVMVNNSCIGGTSGSITVIPQGSSAGYTYSWSTGDTTQTISGLAPGSYTVHIESISGNCGSVDSTIIIGSSPTLASSITSNYCDAALANIIAPDGSNYQWYYSTGTPISAPIGTNDTLSIPSPTSGNTYILAYNTNLGCRDSIIYTIQFSSLPGAFNALAGSACGTADISYIGSTSPSFTYTITGPGYSNILYDTTITSFTLTGLAGGTYTATINDNGCSATSSFDISLVVGSSNFNLLQCSGDVVTINSTTSGTHEWYDPNGNSIGTSSGTIVLSPLIEGTYIDTVTTATLCLQVNTYVVTFDSISVNTSMTGNNCYGDTDGTLSIVVIHSPPGASTTWTGPGGYTGSGMAQTNLATGYYTYTVTAGNCSTEDSIYVTGPNAPGDTLQILTAICSGDPSGILVAPSGFTNYQWFYGGTTVSGETNDTITITSTENFPFYTVTFDVPPFGCNYTSSYIVNNPPGPSFIPSEIVNIFSPNKDNINDYFYPFKSLLYAQTEINDMTDQFTIAIYNRWGQLIYESNDYTKPWDGKKDGHLVDAGVYYIHIYYIPHCAIENQNYEFHSTVHVVR